jgi:hypothetical protein
MRTYIMHPSEEPLRLGALATVLEGARLLALRSWLADLYAAARDNVLRQHQLAQRHPSRTTGTRPMVTTGLAATA